MRVEFPYRISKLDVLPEPFAAAAPPAEEIIFVPPQGFGAWQDRRWWRQRRIAEPSRALAVGEDRLWTLEEREEEGVVRREAAFEELLEVEIGNVLLHAWVAFVPDEAEPLRLDFSLVTLADLRRDPQLRAGEIARRRA